MVNGSCVRMGLRSVLLSPREVMIVDTSRLMKISFENFA